MRLALLILYIVGGTMSLLSGTVAMVVRKGERMHRRGWNVFMVGMLTLATSGFFLAVSQRDLAGSDCGRGELLS